MAVGRLKDPRLEFKVVIGFQAASRRGGRTGRSAFDSEQRGKSAVSNPRESPVQLSESPSNTSSLSSLSSNLRDGELSAEPFELCKTKTKTKTEAKNKTIFHVQPERTMDIKAHKHNHVHKLKQIHRVAAGRAKMPALSY